MLAATPLCLRAAEQAEQAAGQAAQEVRLGTEPRSMVLPAGATQLAG